jgi:hypothetical protein
VPCLTPIVFIIFRRPDLTARVFEVIRQAQPRQLLIIADGPRYDSEVILCQQARAITERIDWNCEVLRNYSEINLGSRGRVSSGLNWAFEQVESAIILEDDCLPHESFFNYCETLLEYYRNDQRVMVVSGNNFQNGQQRTPYSYYFSKYNHCWGWATWQRAWKYWEMSSEKWTEFRNSGLLRTVCNDVFEVKYWQDIFDETFFEGKPDTWDYPWTFACWSQGGLTALPEVNLVSNIGFGPEATHTLEDSPYANLPISDIGEIIHPPFVIQHQEADRYTFKTIFNEGTKKKFNILSREIRRKFSELKREKMNGYKSFN